MLHHAIIIDPLSSGRFLADEFLRRGIPSVAVLSGELPQDLAASFQSEKFVETISYDGNMQELRNKISRYSPNCVMIGVETGLELMDDLSAYFGLVGNDPATSSLRRDKFRMQEALRSAGKRCITQTKVTDENEAKAWLKSCNKWPVIVKPVSSAGSDNVILCENVNDAISAVNKIIGSKNLFGQNNRAALIQEYLEGVEWVVDSVSSGGTHVPTNITRYNKFLNIESNVIYRHSQFLPPSDEKYKELIEYAFEVLNVIGLRNGSAHVEIIATSEGPTLVEVNSRMHGGDAVSVLRQCTDVTQLDLSVDSQIDIEQFKKKSKQPIDYRKHLIAHFIVAKQAGVVKKAITEKDLASLPSFVLGHLPKPGSQVRKTVSLTTSPGYVWLAHETESAMWGDQEKLIEMEEAHSLFELT